MSDQITIRSTFTPVEHVTWSCIDNEAILLNLQNGFYYTLNEVGCEAWKLMDAARTLQDIACELYRSYDAEQQQIEADLLGLAGELQQEGLITHIRRGL